MLVLATGDRRFSARQVSARQEPCQPGQGAALGGNRRDGVGQLQMPAAKLPVTVIRAMSSGGRKLRIGPQVPQRGCNRSKVFSRETHPRI
jgi:hypothetical protein